MSWAVTYVDINYDFRELCVKVKEDLLASVERMVSALEDVGLLWWKISSIAILSLRPALIKRCCFSLRSGRMAMSLRKH